MFLDYAHVLVFAIGGAVLVVAGMIAGGLIRPKRKDDAGLEPYECGEEPIGSAWFRFDIRYYTVALVYLLFAVEIAFLFPWARVLKEALSLDGIGVLALVEGLLFVLILAVGLAYAWVKGDLDWVRGVSRTAEDLDEQSTAAPADPEEY